MPDTIREEINEYIEFISEAEFSEYCNYFKGIASNYLKNINNQNSIGITSVHYPEIFIRSCGGAPIYLTGGFEKIPDETEEIFPQISDTTTKTITNLLLNKELQLKDKLRAVLVYNNNDSNRKVKYYLEQEGYRVLFVSEEPFLLEKVPKRFKQDQRDIIRKLMSILKTVITKEKLLKSAETITKSHKLFKDIDNSILETKLKIFIKETYYLTDDIEEWQNEVEKLINKLPKNTKLNEKIFLTGSDIQFPNYKITSLLDENGIYRYKSNCYVPYPYDYSGLNKKLPLPLLLDQIYEIHYKNQYSNNMISRPNIEINEEIDAVIFHLLKGQLLSAYYAGKLEKNCMKKNISFLCIETDSTKADKEQIAIRIEAFSELLGINSFYDKRRERDESKMA
ncbi:hypothetical protein CM240_3184 [Clostridium bornimense]|uniref:Uncharacterized protein n=1 Tax=Clostridium bornimense TaxID=1216932 RepID=W6S066_9CLOT|nr:2-hydroxyacyl-CoA dehydratase family protein [Clostridium bornimense]CDM70301.1 hypothetical protein CM240_3184 [Clostridium bornimense]